MNTNYTIRIQCMLFICLITFKYSAQPPETKSTDSAKQGGLLLRGVKMVSKLMEKKPIVPIEMDTIRRETLTWVKMRMLHFFQTLEVKIFGLTKFSKLKILEKVPSKGIHLSFQWQDIKSAYGLPIARSHIGLYRDKYKKYFGLYTRNFIRPLTRLKEAFIKVLNIYRIRLQTHYNSKKKDIRKIYDVKQREEGEKLLGVAKYHVYEETKALLQDLTSDKMFWSANEMRDIEYFRDTFGKPPIEEKLEKGNWDHGWKRVEQKEQSSSGTDYPSDYIGFQLPPSSDDSEISDWEDGKLTQKSGPKTIEEQLQKRLEEQEMAARVQREKELERRAAQEAKNEAEMRTKPRMRSQSDASGSEKDPSPARHYSPPPAQVPPPVPTYQQPTPPVAPPSTHPNSLSSPPIRPPASHHSVLSDNDDEDEEAKNGATTGKNHEEINTNPLPPPPPDMLPSDGEVEDTLEGNRLYHKVQSKNEEDMRKMECDPETRNTLSTVHPEFKTNELPPECMDLEKKKSAPQPPASQKSEDEPGFGGGGGFGGFFGGGLGRGVQRPADPDTCPKPPSSTSAKHPTSDAVLRPPPEPKDPLEGSTEEDDSDDEFLSSQNLQRKTIPKDSVVPAPPHDSRSIDDSPNVAGNPQSFRFTVTHDLGGGKKMDVETEGKWSISTKPRKDSS